MSGWHLAFTGTNGDMLLSERIFPSCEEAQDFAETIEGDAGFDLIAPDGAIVGFDEADTSIPADLYEAS